MSNMEILEAVRDLESTYRDHSIPAEMDHRRHLDRKELENIFHLVCQSIELRRVDRLSCGSARFGAESLGKSKI